MSALTSLADVNIANIALSHLAISDSIVSLNPPDKTAEARACAFHLPLIRDWLLQSAPWKFAYKYQALASDASSVTGTNFAFPGWRFAYQVPNDMLQPVAVTTAAGLRFGQQFWTGFWGGRAEVGRALPKIPYEIIQSTANPGQLAIATDIASFTGHGPYLFYIGSVSNYALWDPMATQALGAYLAHRAGGPLRADVQLRQAALQLGDTLRTQALAQHLNAAQEDRERASPSVLARR